jgi:hypothetical protein
MLLLSHASQPCRRWLIGTSIHSCQPALVDDLRVYESESFRSLIDS